MAGVRIVSVRSGSDLFAVCGIAVPTRFSVFSASGKTELAIPDVLGGGVLAVTGIGLAFWISIQMGWRNAFGEARGLVTDGWFRFSRNPIYVVTWLGLLGWAIILNDLRVTFLLSLWAAMYWLAPRIEEPWLERQYGDEYCAYKQRTRRFF